VYDHTNHPKKSTLKDGEDSHTLGGSGEGVLGILVDSEIVLSTLYGKTRVFINKTLSTGPLINKTLSTETSYQQFFIVGNLGSGMRCCKFNSTSNVSTVGV